MGRQRGRFCSPEALGERGVTEDELTIFTRIIHRVRTGDSPNACWEWTGSVSGRKPCQYGYVRLPRLPTKTPAHRWLYQFLHGQIPDGMVVRHTCDNTRCVNPKHLDVGTQRQNVIDMFDRKRVRRDGEHHPGAKISWEQVREIRFLAKCGVSRKEIGQRFGLTRFHVHDILTGRRWKEESAA